MKPSYSAHRARERVFNAFFLHKILSRVRQRSSCAQTKQNSVHTAASVLHYASALSHFKNRVQIHTLVKHTCLCRSADAARRQSGSHVVEYAFALLYGCVRQRIFAHPHLQKCIFCAKKNTPNSSSRASRAKVCVSVSSAPACHHPHRFTTVRQRKPRMRDLGLPKKQTDSHNIGLLPGNSEKQK